MVDLEASFIVNVAWVTLSSLFEMDNDWVLYLAFSISQALKEEFKYCIFRIIRCTFPQIQEERGCVL